MSWNILEYLRLPLCAPTCISDWSWCTSPGDLEGFFSEDISGALPTKCCCRDHLWPCAGSDGGLPAFGLGGLNDLLFSAWWLA